MKGNGSGHTMEGLLQLNRELELKNLFLLSENKRLEEKLSKLCDELRYLRRTLFGRSSERVTDAGPGQLKFAFYEELAVCAASQPVNQTGAAHRAAAPSQRKPVRKPLPDYLERRREVIEPDPLPEGSKHIGNEITEILEYVPGQLYVREIIRRKYALKDGGVVIGDLPGGIPLPKSNAGPSLLAHLLVSKYQDHLPFYRQIEMFRRMGVELAASTVNGWTHAAISLLQPLYDRLKKEVLCCDYVQVDESVIPVLDKDRPGAARKGYHWMVRSPGKRLLFFHYDKGSRAKHVVTDLLEGFQGTLQSDGYVAYDSYEGKPGIVLLGCWAHARRKFEQALGNDPPRAKYALNRIRHLYEVERFAAANLLGDEQIKTLRMEKSLPVLENLKKWLQKNQPEVLPSSKIGKAISYALNIYGRLERYVSDGRFHIDNNLAENAVRPLALGRKNYLFCSNHQSAERTAVIYSLLGTCKAWGVNPVVWLTDVLDRIQEHSVLRLDELLPGKWKPESPRCSSDPLPSIPAAAPVQAAHA